MKTKNRAITIILTLSVIAAFFLFANIVFPKAQVTSSASAANWQLTIKGLVEHQLTLNLTEITALPSTSEYATIYCVDFPTTIVTQGNWTGVKLSYLLQLAGADPTAKVAFYTSDGYSTDLSMQQALQDDVLVAYQLDGAPLGEILRLVVPGHWGYKWISQLATIELVDYNYLGRWESRGYSDEAKISSGSDSSTIPSSPNLSYPTFPPPSSSVSPSPSVNTPTSTPNSSPTQMTTTSSAPLQTPVPTTTPTSSPLQSISPLPTSTEMTKPDSSFTEAPETSLAPYIVALSALAAAAVGISVVVLRKRQR